MTGLSDLPVTEYYVVLLQPGKVAYSLSLGTTVGLRLSETSELDVLPIDR